MTKPKTKAVAPKKTAKTEQLDIVPVVNAASLYKNVKSVAAAIKTAHASQSDLQVEYQRIAVSVIVLLEKHRDISIVRNLFNDMTINLPQGLRVDTMQAFFAKFAPVTFDEKTGEVFFDKEGKAQVANALTTPWWTILKRKTLKAFDLQAEIASLYERASKRKESPKVDDNGKAIADSINPADLNALKRLIKGGNTGTLKNAA